MDDRLYIDCIDATREADGYETLLSGIRRSFDLAVKDDATPLFTTDATDLYTLFLENIPEEARQCYNCSTCRQFVNRFGGLVCISAESGKQTAVMWSGPVPEFFRQAVAAVRAGAEAARITGIFVTDKTELGCARTSIWTHMAVNVPEKIVYKGRIRTTFQEAARKAEDYKVLRASIGKYQQKDVETAVNLLRSDALYRGAQILPMAEWFLETMKLVRGKADSANILWYRAASAPGGFCHIPASMVGTLLDDIIEGYSVSAIRDRFNEKMHPLQYQRPQAAPAAGNVRRAEEIVAELGLEKSLERRFARLDEVQAIWKPVNDKTVEAVVPGGVFAGIPIKKKQGEARDQVQAPETVMTFEKFCRTVLPGAEKMELLVGTHKDSYAAFLTAVHSDAPPVIRWDWEDERNPFSWYLYNKGSSCERWNLSPGWNVVTAVVLQPNMWSDRPCGYVTNGAMFVLKGAKDLNGSSSAGLFPSFLRGELYEVRATIEAYSNNTRAVGNEDASVCGLLIQDSSNNLSVRLRVTTDVGIALYKIDRWD